MTARIRGRGIVRGTVRGAALLSAAPISFLGDLDIRTGRVTGRLSDLHGRSIAGRVLIVPSTRGSAGAWRFIHQLRQHRTHPLALLTEELPDPSVVQGAILSGIPVIAGVASALGAAVSDNTLLAVDGAAGTVDILVDGTG